jgi:hypothetical protein
MASSTIWIAHPQKPMIHLPSRNSAAVIDLLHVCVRQSCLVFAHAAAGVVTVAAESNFLMRSLLDEMELGIRPGKFVTVACLLLLVGRLGFVYCIRIVWFRFGAPDKPTSGQCGEVGRWVSCGRGGDCDASTGKAA